MSNIFRIDDLSINTDRTRFEQMVSLLRERFNDCRIMVAVSPCVHSKVGERVFPSAQSRESDFTKFYLADKVGIPAEMMTRADEVAAHGMVHVDHRLLKRSAQELSIVLSCSLVGCRTVVPPFHHFNEKTADVCAKHGIKLVRFHDRMMHLKLNTVTPDRDYYYFHTHDFLNMDDFKRRIGA